MTVCPTTYNGLDGQTCDLDVSLISRECTQWGGIDSERKTLDIFINWGKLYCCNSHIIDTF